MQDGHTARRFMNSPLKLAHHAEASPCCTAPGVPMPDLSSGAFPMLAHADGSVSVSLQSQVI